ncbi:hypothetical protein [Cohnella panacarvi]|uniref:hypothetical protein n=1 Tax=Cohnella panacarvi TaxID=400776 RepID=UPI00047879D0|nr:hypothetical protein [Cohnella panacarvi]
MATEHHDRRLYEHLRRYNDCSYVNEFFVLTRNEQLLGSANQHKSNFRVHFLFIVYTLVSALLLIINLVHKHKIDDSKELAVARVAREKDRIMNVRPGLQFIGDNIKNRDFTIYRIGNRYSRLMFLCTSYVKLCLRDFYTIKDILRDEQLFPNRLAFLSWYVNRIPHTVVYGNAVENVISSYPFSDVYIGATHDRFALVTGRITNKYNKRLICIPHGVETTVKMPGGYVGDVFYCSSLEMAEKLNNVYETSKFTFDQEVTIRMYQVKKSVSDHYRDREKHFVFFTQPSFAERTKNIIVMIANHLKTKNQKLYLKLHPIDNPLDFVVENTEFINDFRESIIGNVCISTLSTALLEAIYNDSTPITVIRLISDTDVLTGHSEYLNDKRIFKPKDERALIELIDYIIVEHDKLK